jgi:hypothetical protein
VYFSDPVAVQQWVWNSLSTENFNATALPGDAQVSSPVATPGAVNP